jgi:predicted ferric reductase
LLIQPTRNLGLVARHLREVELPIDQNVDGLRHRRVKLDNPFCLRVGQFLFLNRRQP